MHEGVPVEGVGVAEQPGAQLDPGHGMPCRTPRGQRTEHRRGVAHHLLGVGAGGEQAGPTQAGHPVRRPGLADQLQGQGQGRLPGGVPLRPGGRAVHQRAPGHPGHHLEQTARSGPLAQPGVQLGQIHPLPVPHRGAAEQGGQGLPLRARARAEHDIPARCEPVALEAGAEALPDGLQRRVIDPGRQVAHPTLSSVRPSQRYSYWAMPRCAGSRSAS
uniref:hypothetical protein n=1 Tax=Ornithinimicrobium sp. CNJ-824 TaxID=1904966 RepID=UPI0016511B6D|nr:hypothetical protein [Ornithinimicrobium sp. CNJ-824]